MRYLFFVAAVTLIAGPGAASECVFSVVGDAGIPGHNQETVTTGSAAECMGACSAREWCRSVDYERANGGCYLQPVGRHDATLDRNYGGNPYDHFTCESRIGSAGDGKRGGAGDVAVQCQFTKIANAGIPGYNDEVLQDLSARACLNACNARDWCKSVDFERDPGTCILQPVGRHDVDLNQDYGGNPYDHYTCEGR
ncbi:MAG: hypothetical protein GY717_07760 [Rhodobacteraceae bacterium]|nr:hypothetical protein [Paracoccaceae bacterium]